MATVTASLIAERWLDEVLLIGRLTDTTGAPFADYVRLPPGLGDVAIIEIHFDAYSLATLATLPLAVFAFVVSADAATAVDIIGVEEVKKVGAARYGAYFSPDPLVLWRQNELLSVQGPELDSNGAPTGDSDVYIKAVRVRPIETPASPLQLVR